MKSLFTILFILASVAAANASQPVDAERINSIEARQESDWLVHGYSNREQRHSPLKQITKSNVNQLGLEWFFETDYQRGLEATPIVVDGVMYISGNWSMVYALNAKTGALLWKYDPKVPKAWGKMACCDVVNRGVAFWQGSVFVGTLDGRLVALDAATGELQWETLTVDHHLDKNYPYTITGAPRVAKGKVYIGNGGAEYGVRGYISAFDAKTGKQLWRFYTVPGNPEEGVESDAMAEAVQTWTGQWWKTGGGGTVWDSIVYDHELDQLLIGVGNGSPWNREIRSPDGGDNLYLSSIVALNPDTGDYLWHYQEVPKENWDYTATQQIMLADMEINGESKKVIWHAPKNGFFFVIDRSNGKLLSAEPFADVNWASHYDLATGRPVETEAANYQADGASIIKPSSLGAHSWQSMAHNPDTGWVYIPAMESAFEYKTLEKEYKHQPGHWNTGVEDPRPVGAPPELTQALLRNITTGHLLAWDPVTQTEKWRVPHKLMWNGGVLSTAGGLIFQGTADGQFRAYDASNGSQLWEFIAQVGIVAAPVTYRVDGEQYIAVLAGRGGVFSLAGGIEVGPKMSRSRVLVFKLGASKVLPVLIEQRVTPSLPAIPEVSDEVMQQGSNLYHQYCAGCHGFNVVSNGVVPDLKYLPEAFYQPTLFNQIVLEGQFKGLGMVGFADVLSQQDSDAIYAYILQRGHEEQTLKQQQGAWYDLRVWFYEKIAALIGWLI